MLLFDESYKKMITANVAIPLKDSSEAEKFLAHKQEDVKQQEKRAWKGWPRLIVVDKYKSMSVAALIRQHAGDFPETRRKNE